MPRFPEDPSNVIGPSDNELNAVFANDQLAGAKDAATPIDLRESIGLVPESLIVFGFWALQEDRLEDARKLGLEASVCDDRRSREAGFRLLAWVNIGLGDDRRAPFYARRMKEPDPLMDSVFQIHRGEKERAIYNIASALVAEPDNGVKLSAVRVCMDHGLLRPVIARLLDRHGENGLTEVSKIGGLLHRFGYDRERQILTEALAERFSGQGDDGHGLADGGEDRAA